MLGTKIISIVAAIVVLAVGSWGAMNYIKLKRAEAEVAEITAQRDRAAKARDDAINAARTNQETINRLMLEKQDIERSLIALENARRANRQLINKLSERVKELSTDPVNQAPLSPVLKETVDAIQKQRAATEGAPK
jgi:chromosome segregation ATPase